MSVSVSVSVSVCACPCHPCMRAMCQCSAILAKSHFVAQVMRLLALACLSCPEGGHSVGSLEDCLWIHVKEAATMHSEAGACGWLPQPRLLRAQRLQA